MANAGSLAISAAPVGLRRMFDIEDRKTVSTGKVIWQRYTPNKDRGAELLNHLAQWCKTPNEIDTAKLVGATGPEGKPYEKIGQFLNTVMANFGAHSFVGSTTFHNNDENRYPPDANNPERYAEYGFLGVEQTRIVYDRIARTCYLSTHYEAPKVLLVNGAAPMAAMNYIDHDLTVTRYHAPIGVGPVPVAAPVVAPAAVVGAPAPAAKAPSKKEQREQKAAQKQGQKEARQAQVKSTQVPGKKK